MNESGAGHFLWYRNRHALNLQSLCTRYKDFCLIQGVRSSTTFLKTTDLHRAREIELETKVAFVKHHTALPLINTCLTCDRIADLNLCTFMVTVLYPNAHNAYLILWLLKVVWVCCVDTPECSKREQFHTNVAFILAVLLPHQHPDALVFSICHTSPRLAFSVTLARHSHLAEIFSCDR